MIYIFYTALGLAAVISIGTIKAQIAHIKGLKQIYKEESRKAHALQLEALDLKAKLRETTDAKMTWAKVAHEAAEDLNYLTRVHAGNWTPCVYKFTKQSSLCTELESRRDAASGKEGG